ncbi:MAG: hypothetical protein AAFZ65_17785 [Planctomycetota bacterium]
MAVVHIPIDEMRRAEPSLKRLGDSVVISGLWAPDQETEPRSTLLVVERVEGGFLFTPMAVEYS